MEFVRLTAAEALMDGRVVVRHSDTTLARGLEPGEEIVVLDADGELRSAHVVDLDFSLTDTHYVLEVGLRLPEEVASRRIEGEQEDAGMTELLGLLGELRTRPVEQRRQV
ncbi:hypothetical protein [Nocardioides sp. R-C-SC26]|uniref:hypothetical protein n=1 Tax=Nocardioides sp. R-C-SC26 TaxID=2870414 RepID=UPI001E5890AD|nr:hypothetical protein [Nocardioides sp. R-C-SC26]